MEDKIENNVFSAEASLRRFVEEELATPPQFRYFYNQYKFSIHKIAKVKEEFVNKIIERKNCVTDALLKAMFDNLLCDIEDDGSDEKNIKSLAIEYSLRRIGFQNSSSLKIKSAYVRQNYEKVAGSLRHIIAANACKNHPGYLAITKDGLCIHCKRR